MSNFFAKDFFKGSFFSEPFFSKPFFKETFFAGLGAVTPPANPTKVTDPLKAGTKPATNPKVTK